jgi:hypothetical protein
MRWSQVNRAVWIPIKDPTVHMPESAFMKIFELVKTHGPLNRYELALLCRSIETVQDIQLLLTKAKRHLEQQGSIEVILAKDFCIRYLQIGPGITFHPAGGYTVKDEFGNNNGNWRTSDEAFIAHEKYYRHIPLPQEQENDKMDFLDQELIDHPIYTGIEDDQMEELPNAHIIPPKL